MVTNACNARCAFCVQEATYKSAQIGNDRFLPELRRHFADFHQCGGRKVVITGGEPLLVLPRVLVVLAELAKYEDLTVKALYTNGERLVHSHTGGGSYASALAQAGLGCVNLSVHHDASDENSRILGLPQKAPTESIITHLHSCRLPFRLNLTLQRNGIACATDLKRYVRWGFALGAQDIYVRELFSFAFAEPKSDSDRDPLAFCRTNAVSAAPLVEQLKKEPEYQFVQATQERLRDKSESEFLHRPSGRKVFVSSLTIGTESKEKAPYLVLMSDGNLYRGWLDAADRIPAVSSAED